MDVAVVGPGRLGLQLAAALAASGRVRVRLRGRGAPPAERPPALVGVPWDGWSHPERPLDEPLVVLAVPDREIGAAAAALARGGPMRGRVVLHTSGLARSDALVPCWEAGAAVGSWHPLQSFPPLATGAVPWEDVWVAVEGDPTAVAAGFELARALDAHPWRIAPGDKARYHAAAAVAVNLTHVLLAEALDLLEACGLPRRDAARALAPAVRTGVEAALAARGLERLTGPLVRGDAATVARHLEVLPPEVAEVYRALAALVRRRLAGNGRSPQ